MPIPGGSPSAPVVSPGATVTGLGTVKRVVSGNTVTWVIQADSGHTFLPIAGLHASFRQNGLRIAFTGTVASGSVGGGNIPMELLSVTGLSTQ
jgi:hypothetical protein